MSNGAKKSSQHREGFIGVRDIHKICGEVENETTTVILPEITQKLLMDLDEIFRVYSLRDMDKSILFRKPLFRRMGPRANVGQCYQKSYQICHNNIFRLQNLKCWDCLSIIIVPNALLVLFLYLR